MSEKEQDQQIEQSQDQQFSIQKIFVKDLSFESPNSPQIYTEQWEPNVNIELHSSGKQISEGVHEVVLGITVTAKLAEKTAYLIEIQQAGIFTINGFAQQEMGAMLGSYCPNLLYPYAREAISDVVSKAGFPQMILAPVNFDAIYQDHLRRQQEEQEAQPGPDAIH